MSRGSLRSRVYQRVRRAQRRLVLRLLGRPLLCSECGHELFRGRAFVLGGRVRIIGALEPNIHVSFATKETLEFRHMERDHCPSPSRPWAVADR